jgi:hypothetical protein
LPAWQSRSRSCPGELRSRRAGAEPGVKGVARFEIDGTRPPRREVAPGWRGGAPSLGSQ